MERDQTYYQEAAEGGEAVAAEKAAADLNGGPKDVEYASIDFSALKRKNPGEAAKKHESTETEYAEIKKEVKEEREDNGEEEGEVSEYKEEEAMIGEDEETKHCVPEEEEGEDEAVYSNVKDVMGEIWGLCCIVELREDKVSFLSSDVMDWCNGLMMDCYSGEWMKVPWTVSTTELWSSNGNFSLW